MPGKCRPSLRGKTLANAMYSNLSQTDKDCIKAVFERYEERPKGRWKYYHKQNIAVCTNCSFERKLDADFGKAITCPNCGADMRGESDE